MKFNLCFAGEPTLSVGTIEINDAGILNGLMHGHDFTLSPSINNDVPDPMIIGIYPIPIAYSNTQE